MAFTNGSITVDGIPSAKSLAGIDGAKDVGPTVVRQFFEFFDDICIVDEELEETDPGAMMNCDDASHVNCNKATYVYLANVEIDEEAYLKLDIIVDKKTGKMVYEL